jgi:hypothetical protein
MTEQNNRVLARKGARSLTLAEIDQVSGNFGGVGTPILLTERITNQFPGRIDREFDEMQA